MICINSVTVYPSSATIRKGQWYYDAWASISSNCPECAEVRWYSNNSAIASVNATTGYIYGVNTGATRVYAEATDGSGKKDYITVTVTNGTICVDSVTLNRSSILLEKGDTFTLCATVCPTNATNKSISWRSTNSAVASVSGGVVTAKARGYAYIYAEAQDGSGEYDSCYVNVTEDILVTSVTISPSSKTMNIGASAYLYETVCPTNATNKCVKWSSNKTSVATVNPDTGLVIAQGAGTATITATAQDGSNKKGYCTITVNPPVTVTGVEVCPTSLTMSVGDMEYVCASITPSNATNQTVTWCSSNENVATVGLYTGKVTAQKAGTTTITATTADGGFQAWCTIEVSLTDEQLSEQIVFCFSLLTEYSSYAYLSPMQYAVLKNLNSVEAAISEQTELLQSIQLVNYILLENKLVANSPTASTVIARHILSGEKYDIFEQAEITQDIRNHSDVFDEVWKERNKQSWLELAQLLVSLGTMIPYIQIPASLILLSQGIVGEDFSGRQLHWWERALDITSGVLATIEGISILSSAIKNANNVKILDKLDDIARIAGDHAASEYAYALRTGRISNRVLNGTLDVVLINKAKGFRGRLSMN